MVNVLLAGVPRPFTTMSVPQRERYLRGWATSRLPLRRKAFQALKRMATVIAYTVRGPSGSNPSWPRLGYPGPLGPPPATPKRIRLLEGARLLEAAGAKEIWSTRPRWLAYRPDGTGAPRARWMESVDGIGFGPNQLLLATFHQMASCRMGASARDSVVTPEHQVWGIPGLYVADASTFPSASGVNPMLTVMGIAHRAAGIIGSRV